LADVAGSAADDGLLNGQTEPISFINVEGSGSESVRSPWRRMSHVADGTFPRATFGAARDFAGGCETRFA
jgi:hypothetical protein